jgi:uncharacterized repeat protein (TIGR01451 family)
MVVGVFLALVVGVSSSSAAGELVVGLTGSPVANGENATLTVDMTNNDPNSAGGVPATKLTLPSGVTYVSASSGVLCTLGTGFVSCTHGTVLGNGGTDTFGPGCWARQF